MPALEAGCRCAYELLLPGDAPLACPATIPSPLPQAAGVLRAKAPGLTCEGRDGRGAPARVPVHTLISRGAAPALGPESSAPAAAAPSAAAAAAAAAGGSSRSGGALGVAAKAGVAVAVVAVVVGLVALGVVLRPTIEVRGGRGGGRRKEGGKEEDWSRIAPGRAQERAHHSNRYHAPTLNTLNLLPPPKPPKPSSQARLTASAPNSRLTRALIGAGDAACEVTVVPRRRGNADLDGCQLAEHKATAAARDALV